MTTNKEHLQWVHDRIIEVYGESENVDFLIRMRKIIDNQESDCNSHSIISVLQSIDRFDIESWPDGCPDITKCDDGEWVKWDDINKLIHGLSKNYGKH